jgi:hypothetical protein
MEYNIINLNNNCYKCINKLECNECKEGLIKAKDFFDNITGIKNYTKKIILELDDNLVLSNKQIKYLTSNKKYWWIKKNNDFHNIKFIEISKIEGNKKFKMELELESGNYTIGCGTSKNGIKKDFSVKNNELIFLK